MEKMCLSANEPGGPRRCNTYMRTVNGIMNALQHNESETAAFRDLIEQTESRIEKTEALDPQHLSPSDQANYQRMIDACKRSVDNYRMRISELEEERPVLHKRAMNAIANHDEEMDRRYRMGLVDEGTTEENFDDYKPYITVARANAEPMREYAHEQGTEVTTRTRYIPVKLGEDAHHPYLTVCEVDMQFADDNDKFTSTFQGDPLRNDFHQDQTEWHAPTDKVLQASLDYSQGGAQYVSQRQAQEDPSQATGNLVRNAIFNDTEGRYVDETSGEAQEFLKFARRFPGDNSFAQRVRQVANKDQVASKDIPLLASAVAEWGRYKGRVQKPQPQPQHNQSSAPRQQSTPTAQNRVAQSEWIGAVGDRLVDTKVTLKRVDKYDSQFGGKMTMLIAQDEAGHTIKWRASNDLPVQTGDVLSLRGLIQDHAEYRGTKQTVIKNGAYDILAHSSQH